jgi:hypothetical protein
MSRNPFCYHHHHFSPPPLTITLFSLIFLPVGTDCGGPSMSKVLWYLLFLAFCRALQAFALILNVPALLLGCAVFLAHFYMWGRPSLAAELQGGGSGGGEAWLGLANFLLDDCKVIRTQNLNLLRLELS